MKIKMSPFREQQLLSSSVSFLSKSSDDESTEGVIIGMILTLLMVTGAPTLCYVATAVIVGIYFGIKQGEEDES